MVKARKSLRSTVSRNIQALITHQELLKNVHVADLTIILAAKLGSPGEICTIKALKRHQRPFLIVPFSAPPNFKTPLTPAHVAYMIEYAAPSFKIINIAGNSEQTCPRIYEATLPYLSALFQLLLLHKKS
jgi:hypothetical protein